MESVIERVAARAIPPSFILFLLVVVGIAVFLVDLQQGWAQINPEEVATESVYPRFDEADVVKKRNITLAQKLKLGLLGGVVRNDPFFEAYDLAGQATYHFTEDHAIFAWLNVFMNSVSSNTRRIGQQLDTISGLPLVPNLELTPERKFLFLIGYEVTPYYGKLSITKETVRRLSISGHVGVGPIFIGESIYPAAGFGISQNVYLVGQWALVADIRALFFSGPDPLSRNLSGVSRTLKASEYETKTHFNLALSLGISYLM